MPSSQTSVTHDPTVLSIALPEYDLRSGFDHEQLGGRLDQLVLAHLPEGEYLQRAIGIQDHPGKSRADLVDLIIRHGTDLYDPLRTSFCAADFADYQYDIHASAFAIRAGVLEFEPDGFRSYFAGTLYDFQHNAKLDRGYPVRVDIVMVYAKPALHRRIQVENKQPSSAKFSKYLYRFRNDIENKGLCGIIIIE